MDLLGAVETGGTLVRCARGTGPHDVHEAVAIPTTDDPVAVVTAVLAFFAAGPPVARVGVAAFGPIEVDPDALGWGRLLRTPKPGWSGFALGPALREGLGVPVVLDSDVNAAALAEGSEGGAAPGVRPLAYLTVGTGIGLGVLVGEAPLRGLLHPEGGHLRVPRAPGDEGFAGTCPYHGDCWEGLASGPAIAARWGVDPVRLPLGHPAWALEAGYVAAGLAAVALVLSPRRIVLGGGVGGRPDVLAGVRERLPALLAGGFDRPADVAAASALVVPPAHADAGLAGALGLAASGAMAVD